MREILAYDLPEPASSFVGRGRELAEIAASFERGARLVTVVGPGGVGKTRLVLEFTRDAIGVVRCDLTEAKTLRDLVTSASRALAIRLWPGASDTDALGYLGRFLAARGPMVLVLDNLVPIATEAALAIARLIDGAPRLRVVATARERLRVRGEVVLDLEPLPVPGADDEALAASPSVQFFYDRARSSRAGWGAGDEATVAAIVRRLEGFPLAIELCATFARALAPASLLARIERGFEVVGRPATLARAIAWSCQDLALAERSVLAQASVFAGGFTLAAAELVIDPGPGAPQMTELLEALADKSLVRVDRRTGRFSLYSALREHAAALLDELGGAAPARARHAEYYLKLGERLVQEVESRGGDARGALATERENLAAVYGRSLEAPGRAGEALRAALVLDEILAVEGPFREHLPAIDAALRATEAAGVAPRLHALGLEARGRALRAAGRTADAIADLERALEIAVGAGDRAAEARARGSLCVALRVAGRLDEAREHGERALALHGELQLPRFEVASLGALAALELHAGRAEGAGALFARAELLSHRLGDRWSEAMSIAFQGHAHQECGALFKAEDAFERAIARFRELGDARHAAIFEGYLAGVLHERGDLPRARDCYTRATRELASLGCTRFEGLFLAGLGAAAAEMGLRDEARAVFDDAADRLDSAADPALRLVLDLHLLHLAVASTGATAALARSAALLRERPLATSSDEVRFALRVLHFTLRVLHRANAAAKAPVASVAPLRLGRDARWFQPAGGERIDLARKRSLRLLLAGLVDTRLRSPGQALDWQALLALGWPGDRVGAEAGAHRVRVAIATLRRSGLRAILLSRDDGYLLDPAAPIELSAD
ncbi:ATP-binding protein [Nannocystis radixulma]|uniref:Tetratricopeptide repeat protein n=1 Tax=Nannocystis radixulma TaxID=2995305 RepID=A0ABT5BEP2_9BACT|nr:AAA family ATPase [Nannocystis radixulma]MDC0672615.1 tetratricopeptide repeat protein [Nannocystis radixulma]